MNCLRRVLVVAVLGCCLLPVLRADDAKPSNPLDDYAVFIGGSWVGKGKLAKDDFRTRVSYEWGINKKLIKSKSYLRSDKGEQLVYESIFAYHPGKKKVVFMSFSSAGYIFDGTVEKKGDAFEYLFDSFADDKKTTYRQTIQFVDKDHAEWQVYTKNGDEWSKVIDSRQERQAK